MSYLAIDDGFKGLTDISCHIRCFNRFDKLNTFGNLLPARSRILKTVSPEADGQIFKVLIGHGMMYLIAIDTIKEEETLVLISPTD